MFLFKFYDIILKMYKPYAIIFFNFVILDTTGEN